MVSVSFCGDYACCYETEQADDLFVTLEMEWYTALGGDVKKFLSSVREYDMFLGATDDSFLDAGFLKIGKFEGYKIFCRSNVQLMGKSSWKHSEYRAVLDSMLCR